MEINQSTKISAVLKAHPEAMEAIIAVNPVFAKLRNPVLRKLLTSRVSVAMAAQVGGVAMNEIYKALQPLGFTFKEIQNMNEIKEAKTEQKPINHDQIISLDVRPILDSGVDPFKVIMETLETMEAAKTLCIINSFEPIPLLNLISKKGYSYRTDRSEVGIVKTYIFQGDNQEKQLVEVKSERLLPKTFGEACEYFDSRTEMLDVRQLDMPMPMVEILKAVELLDEKSALFVHHKRIPQYLIPELEDRGFAYFSNEIDDENTKLIIFKK